MCELEMEPRQLRDSLGNSFDLNNGFKLCSCGLRARIYVSCLGRSILWAASMEAPQRVDPSQGTDTREAQSGSDLSEGTCPGSVTLETET